MQKSMIGITASQDDKENTYLNNQMYARCIYKAGGIAVLLPPIENYQEYDSLLDRLDGILFSGGADIHPKYFGEECLEGFSMDYFMTPERDQYEIALYQAAYKRDMPILGICRGIQLMAIAGGGTIYQDIDTCMSRPIRIRHNQKVAYQYDTHKVYIEKGSRLHNITQTDEILVNSMHHQAVADIPQGYSMCGYAPDGVIEAMEDDSKRFCIGVQWHPERTAGRDLISRQLFQEFVKAAEESK